MSKDEEGKRYLKRVGSILAFMTLILLLLLATGCSSEPLTEDEIFDKEYEEAERKAAYLTWEERCLAEGKIVFVYKAIRPCRKLRGCIPHKWDWRYNLEKDKPHVGNAYTCLTMNEAMNRMNF